MNQNFVHFRLFQRKKYTLACANQTKFSGVEEKKILNSSWVSSKTTEKQLENIYCYTKTIRINMIESTQTHTSAQIMSSRHNFHWIYLLNTGKYGFWWEKENKDRNEIQSFRSLLLKAKKLLRLVCLEFNYFDINENRENQFLFFVCVCV